MTTTTARMLMVLAAGWALAGAAWGQGGPGGPRVSQDVLRTHLITLASDEFEGRGTGQPGGDKTVAYLERHARSIGLKPAHGDSFRQSVRLFGVRSRIADSSVDLEAGGKALGLRFGDDWMWRSGDGRALNELDAEIVFVGYGITAPEEGWDDFKGLDCRGKVLLVLGDDPVPTAAEPDRFGGRSMTYYGRGPYKFEEGKRRGAAGVLVMYNAKSRFDPWSSVRNNWSVEVFKLKDQGGTGVEGLLTPEAAARLVRAAGRDFDALRAAAERRDMQPVVLNARIRGRMVSDVREIEQFNVAGLVPGTDPVLKDELVIYSAHWDHLGRTAGEGDVIYNGAWDNATGAAALLAMAQASVAAPTRRTQMFLWPAAEEHMMLGSKAYVASPPWPLARTAAALNLDSMNTAGRTRDIGVPGSDRSDLHALAAATAKEMNRTFAKVWPDVRGEFFRADHFSFVQAGIPAFSIDWGLDFIDDPIVSKRRMLDIASRYHQVNDEFDPNWDLAGTTEDAQFTLNLGRRVANADAMPAWKAGDPYGRLRAK